MTATGLTLTSHPIGQRITFLRTAADTGGAELVLEAWMNPASFIPAHRHLYQEETFEVLSGVGTFTVGGKRIVAGAGERVQIQPGVKHRFRNRSDAEVHVRATMRPALRAEEVFERLFRLGEEGRVNGLGAPSPLQTARLIREFRDEFFYLAAIPVALQRVLAGARP